MDPQVRRALSNLADREGQVQADALVNQVAQHQIAGFPSLLPIAKWLADAINGLSPLGAAELLMKLGIFLDETLPPDWEPSCTEKVL
jgi:hypothetical protein